PAAGDDRYASRGKRVPRQRACDDLRCARSVLREAVEPRPAPTVPFHNARTCASPGPGLSCNASHDPTTPGVAPPGLHATDGRARARTRPGRELHAPVRPARPDFGAVADRR